VVDVCEQLARQAVVAAGGRIERDPTGQEVFVIPVLDPQPLPLEQSWAPGPIADSKFTTEERAHITHLDELAQALKLVAPGWELKDCGFDMGAPALLEEHAGRKKVLITHPLDRQTGCTLSRTVKLAAGGHPRLRAVVGHFPRGDWLLVVKADGKVLREQVVGPDTAPGGWLEVTVDLAEYAGREVKLELVNQPNGWAWEAGYWAEVRVEGEEGGPPSNAPR
jgi:hypothetical protein